jgi:hypothetical protein
MAQIFSISLTFEKQGAVFEHVHQEKKETHLIKDLITDPLNNLILLMWPCK